MTGGGHRLASGDLGPHDRRPLGAGPRTTTLAMRARPQSRDICPGRTVEPDAARTSIPPCRYVISREKVTLAPYTGLGAARGFELDFYDGALFLVGDLVRLVVARKLEGS